MASDKAYGFDARSTQRISRAVRTVEGQATDLRGTPLRRRTAISSDTLIASITGNADDPGDYNGRIRNPDGTYPLFDDCLIRNTEESLSNGHGLRVGQELVVKDTGQVTEDDPPRKIVYTVGGEARTDTPTELPVGSGLTLDTTEWNRDTSDGPVTWTPSRGVYSTTTHKLYVVTRVATYDARGHLYSVGPEVATEYTTATTGCPNP